MRSGGPRNTGYIAVETSSSYFACTLFLVPFLSATGGRWWLWARCRLDSTCITTERAARVKTEREGCDVSLYPLQPLQCGHKAEPSSSVLPSTVLSFFRQCLSARLQRSSVRVLIEQAGRGGFAQAVACALQARGAAGSERADFGRWQRFCSHLGTVDSAGCPPSPQVLDLAWPSRLRTIEMRERQASCVRALDLQRDGLALPRPSVQDPRLSAPRGKVDSFWMLCVVVRGRSRSDHRVSPLRQASTVVQRGRRGREGQLRAACMSS